MIRHFNPMSILSFLRNALIVLLVLWAAISTILLLRMKPQVVLVGIDPYGTRLITSENDRLLKGERENFVKKYLAYAYNYSSASFDSRISVAGDMMTQKLWQEKKEEFARISEGLKKHELSQTAKVLELREIDPENFEADLEIRVKTKFQEATTKLRLEIKLRKARRFDQNPYPYEVANYAEQIIS